MTDNNKKTENAVAMLQALSAVDSELLEKSEQRKTKVIPFTARTQRIVAACIGFVVLGGIALTTQLKPEMKQSNSFADAAMVANTTAVTMEETEYSTAIMAEDNGGEVADAEAPAGANQEELMESLIKAGEESDFFADKKANMEDLFTNSTGSQSDAATLSVLLQNAQALQRIRLPEGYTIDSTYVEGDAVVVEVSGEEQNFTLRLKTTDEAQKETVTAPANTEVETVTDVTIPTIVYGADMAEQIAAFKNVTECIVILDENTQVTYEGNLTTEELIELIEALQ